MARGQSFRFSRKYSLFLSEASNEEIVSISKELSSEMATQTRTLAVTAVGMVIAAAVVPMVAVLLIQQAGDTVTAYDTAVKFVRFLSLAMMCISALTAMMAVSRSLKASSMSTLMWRNVRESPSDESAYEQTNAMNRLNRLLFTGRNNLRVSAMLLAAAVTLFTATFAFEMLSVMGYFRWPSAISRNHASRSPAPMKGRVRDGVPDAGTPPISAARRPSPRSACLPGGAEGGASTPPPAPAPRSRKGTRSPPETQGRNSERPGYPSGRSLRSARKCGRR